MKERGMVGCRQEFHGRPGDGGGHQQVFSMPDVGKSVRVAAYRSSSGSEATMSTAVPQTALEPAD